MHVKHESYITPQEYLDLERRAETKSEYYAGEIYAMASASVNHTSVVANVVYLFVGQLKGRRCSTHSTDLRVKVRATGLYTYPDVLVVCGTPQFEDRHRDTLLNPTVIVEVLSDSTEAYDRGAKFQMYRTLDSLTDYLLISQNEAVVEHYVRQAEGHWLFIETRGLDSVVEIPSIDCTLALADIYDKVDFDAVAGQPRLRVVKEPEVDYTATIV